MFNKLQKCKKGVNVAGLATGLIAIVIAFILVMTLLGSTIDDVQAAGNTVNDSGAPLSGLFAGDSILVLALMASVLVGLVGLGFAFKG